MLAISAKQLHRLRASRAAGLAHPQRHRTLAPRILPVRAAAGRPAEHHPVQALQEADAAVGGVPAHPRVPAQEEREGAEEEGAEGGEPQGARGAAEGGAGRGRGGARRRRRRVGGGREPSRRRGGGIGGGGVGDGQEERRGGGQEAQGRGRGRQGADQEEDQEGARGGQAQGGQAQGPRRRGEAVRRAAAQRADVRAQPDVQEPRHGRQARRAGPQPALRRAAGGLPEEEPGQAAEWVPPLSHSPMTSPAGEMLTRPAEAAIDANAPLLDDAADEAGPVDSDEETELVMAGLARARPRPLDQHVHVPMRRKCHYLRVKELLSSALGGARGSVFAGVGAAASTASAAAASAGAGAGASGGGGGGEGDGRRMSFAQPGGARPPGPGTGAAPSRKPSGAGVVTGTPAPIAT